MSATHVSEPMAEVEEGAQLDEIMRHLRNARRRIAAVQQRAEEQKRSLREEIEADCAAIDQRSLEMTAEDRSNAARLEGEATSLLLSHLARNPNGKKSIDSVYGKVTSRDGGDDVTWPSDEALRGWAEGHGYLREKVTYSIDKAAIRKSCRVLGNRLVTPDGETVPLVEVERKGRSVVVDVG